MPSSAECKAVLVAVGRDVMADLLLTHVLLIRQDSAFVQVSVSKIDPVAAQMASPKNYRRRRRAGGQAPQRAPSYCSAALACPELVTLRRPGNKASPGRFPRSST